MFACHECLDTDVDASIRSNESRVMKSRERTLDRTDDEQRKNAL